MDCCGSGGGRSGNKSKNHNNNNNNNSGPCGACKFLRRKCVKGCIFAPYFATEELGAVEFAAVHKVFGASNASKLLCAIPTRHRLHASITLCYEALARASDPVYGCVAHISALQHQVVKLQTELAYVQARLSTLQRIIPMASSSLPLIPNLETDHHLQPSLFPSSLELTAAGTFLNLDDQQLQLSGGGNTEYLAGGPRFRPFG